MNTPDFDVWWRPEPDHRAWVGWQFACMGTHMMVWWSRSEHGNDTNDFAIAQDNLGAWWAVLVKDDPSECGSLIIRPAIGPFDSPQIVYATIRLMS